MFVNSDKFDINKLTYYYQTYLTLSIVLNRT